MKRLKWIILSLTILAVFIILAWLVVKPTRQVGEDNLIGLTPAQLRQRYGEPSWVVAQDDWVYYRGRAGGGTGIHFKNGVVTHVEMRDAQ